MSKEEKLISTVLKYQLTPGYLQTVMGMMNPNQKGFMQDGTVEPFIVKTDNNKYDVRIGFSSLGVFDDLDKAKKTKNDQPPLSMQTIQNKLMKDYVNSEKKARKYVESKGKEYSKIPIKNQFVLNNYMLTGHGKEEFLNAVINNDYKEAMKNYMRPEIENANEFFKNVMFPAPINENDLGNVNQAQNYAEKFLDVAYPDEINTSNPKTNLGEKGGKANAIAEFTGGELVNNREDEMRDAIKKGNKDKAANIFRSQVKEKNITPGKASHKTNPLPVAADGTVMNKKGKNTGVKASPGAGVYDHIKDQYDPSMSNEELIKMIQKNHAKWRKNGMG